VFMTAGDRIKELREQRGLTQDELIDLAHPYLPPGKKFVRATLSRIEGNIRHPNSWAIVAIAKALDMPVSYLLGETEREGETPGENVPIPEPELIEVVQNANRLPKNIRQAIAEIFYAIFQLINVVLTERESISEQDARKARMMEGFSVERLERILEAELEMEQRQLAAERRKAERQGGPADLQDSGT
jgi:transcriptional regulator with XRE-family HTH domain